MDLTIDKESKQPPFEQIQHQITRNMVNGTLPPGTKLPTVRRLAEELGVAVNTVAKAYRTLEQAQLIETQGRQGSFVPATATSTDLAARDATVTFVKTLRALGIADSDIPPYVAAVILKRPTL